MLFPVRRSPTLTYTSSAPGYTYREHASCSDHVPRTPLGTFIQKPHARPFDRLDANVYLIVALREGFPSLTYPKPYAPSLSPSPLKVVRATFSPAVPMVKRPYESESDQVPSEAWSFATRLATLNVSKSKSCHRSIRLPAGAAKAEFEYVKKHKSELSNIFFIITEHLAF